MSFVNWYNYGNDVVTVYYAVTMQLVRLSFGGMEFSNVKVGQGLGDWGLGRETWNSGKWQCGDSGMWGLGDMRREHVWARGRGT